MKRMKSFWLLICSLLLLSACNPSPEKMFNEKSSGVVIILNQYYYKLMLNGSQPVYFTGVGEDGSLENATIDDKAIQGQAAMLTGTGFFINERGTIMTNRHVAAPQLDKAQVNAALLKALAATRSIYQRALDELQERYINLMQRNYYYGDAYDTDPAVEERANLLKQKYDEIWQAMRALPTRLTPADFRVQTISKLGIAYNHSRVATLSDFLQANPCVVTKVSNHPEVDLALIQLKTEKTPKDKYVFNIGDKQPSFLEYIRHVFDKDHEPGELKINENLYMIGYNAGLILGNTRKGIKAQMTQGTLTQTPDGDKLMYSIPTIQGSSGSPILDSKGRVVGVNFAKFAGSDSFNFGIPLNRIQAFMRQK